MHDLATIIHRNNEAVAKYHERRKAKLAASLSAYVSGDDEGVDRETFLRNVAERILDDLRAS
jgi:hypothetical protein